MIQHSMQVSVSELANTKELLELQNYVVMSKYHGYFLNLSIAGLGPVDRVQPRSRTTCVGWLARFNGVATIHPIQVLVQNHPASGVQESSVQ